MYTARWDLENHSGLVNLAYKENGVTRWKLYTITDPSEFSAVLDFLRNEGPLDLHIPAGWLQSQNEPVGEGES
ncbi:MAG: hypothetical protein R3A51_07475 [Nannocystaceae bacterium]